MNKILIAFALCLSATAGAWAAANTDAVSGDIVVSTDPSTAAAVERHAQELKARGESTPEAMTASEEKHERKHAARKHMRRAHKSAGAASAAAQ